MSNAEYKLDHTDFFVPVRTAYTELKTHLAEAEIPARVYADSFTVKIIVDMESAADTLQILHRWMDGQFGVEHP